MKRPVPRGLARGAFIILVILGVYVVSSALSLGLGRGNWLLVLAATLFILAISLPYFNRRFGDKLPILNTLGNIMKSSVYRRYLGPILSENVSPSTVQTGRQATIGALAFYSPFIVLLAVAGALSIFRPVSEELTRLLGYAFFAGSFTVAYYFLTLRLRMPYNLTSTIAAIAIYAPIFTLVLGSLLMRRELWDDDPFRPSLILILITCCCGILMTTLLAFSRRYRNNSAPVPAFTYRPPYLRTEIAISLASIAAIALLLLSSFRG